VRSDGAVRARCQGCAGTAIRRSVPPVSDASTENSPPALLTTQYSSQIPSRSACFSDVSPRASTWFRATMGTVSYLADNTVFLRHLEVEGELCKAIGVLKKRTSDFERTVREFRLTSSRA